MKLADVLTLAEFGPIAAEPVNYKPLIPFFALFVPGLCSMPPTAIHPCEPRDWTSCRHCCNWAE
jgi:hypothetical protein